VEERAIETSSPNAVLDASLSERLGNSQPATPPELAVSREAERPAAAAVVARVSAIPDEQPAVRSALYKYQAAYHALDASAAKRIWPAVDERALARAFSGLESQTMTFDSCTINVDTDRAHASCTGHTHYVGRVGNRTGQIQSRDWTFQLSKAGDEWRIDSVRTR